jgi:ribose 5-phosphate isomerase B
MTLLTLLKNKKTPKFMKTQIFSRVGIISDHAGWPLKTKVLEHLKLRVPIEDLGPFVEPTSLDYSAQAIALSSLLNKGALDGGIYICGTGLGMAIVANKYRNIRAASIWSKETAFFSRAHNNLNALCLGGRVLELQEALDIIDVWMTTPFEGGRHEHRIKLLNKLTIGDLGYEQTLANR